MKLVSCRALLCCLVLLVPRVYCYEFSKELIFEPLSAGDFSGMSVGDIVDLADKKLTPVLEKHLLPKMLYPWVKYTKSINPLVIEIPHPTKAEADTAIFGSKKLISHHLKKIIEYCDEFFEGHSSVLEDKTRLGLLIDLHDRFLERLQPKLEAAYIRFWERSEQVM